ncbi:MAG: hypothetical protein Tsb009_00830 [Planctomycetaceae bacterium]
MLSRERGTVFGTVMQSTYSTGKDAMKVSQLSQSAFRFFANLVNQITHLLSTPARQSGFVGCLIGFLLLAFCHPFLATFGTALPAVTAFLIAVAVGIEFGFKATAKSRSPHSNLQTRYLLALIGLVIWQVGFNAMLAGTISLAGRIPAEVMAAPGRAVLFQTLAALLMVTPPMYLISRIPDFLLQIPANIRKSESNSDVPTSHRVKEPPQSGTGISARLIHSLLRWNWRSWFNVVKNRFRTKQNLTWQQTTRSYLRGVFLGVVIGMLIIAPISGIHITALIGCGGILLLTVFTGYRLITRDSELHSLELTSVTEGGTPTSQAVSQIDNHKTSAESSSSLFGHRQWDRIWKWMVVATIGGLAAIVMRMVNQLAATASYLVYMQWATLFAGVACGITRTIRSKQTGFQGSAIDRSTCSSAAFFVASWASLILISFGGLVELSLLCSAFIGSPWLMIACRSLMVFCLIFPLGWGWGRSVIDVSSRESQQEHQSHNETPLLPNPRMFAFAAGYLAIRWLAISEWRTANLLVVLALWLAVLAVSRMLFERFSLSKMRTFPQTKMGRIAFALSLGLLIATPFLKNQYDPTKTARQLFATNVSIARMQGLDRELLSYLDEGRAITQVEGERGTFTVWRYRGLQLQFRENGVPKAIVSTKPGYCPHFTAEVMQAVMPLVLHDHPHRVLILGLGGGVPLTTSLAFPTMHVTCVENDSALPSLLKRTVWKESGMDPFQDERFRYLQLDPALAVACRGENYDVVISSPDQSALLQATSQFTRRFYLGVSRQLASHGIFCQRFHQVDYGPIALQTTVKTLQSVFRNVVAIEIASGEMALLATNSEKGLSRGGLLERFQAPHVRKALAEIGWDWSIPLNLTAFSHEGLKTFANATPNTLNTTTNGRLAFRLPPEMMRWGPKWEELLTLIAPHGSRFAESGNIAPDNPELLRRLAETTGQRKLMTAYPDQWWAYRKSLKEQIKQRPRTLIQKVGYESKSGAFHPEDRRRMRYFSTLDRAMKNPTLGNIQRLSRFEEPYDPLLSYFVHQEAAELYARSQEKDYAEELRHRLHAIYFAHPHDRSVRNVAAAMNLLARQESCVESAESRYDHLNALLQIMKGRWKVRGLVKPKSIQIVLNDIDRCLEAIELAMTTMDSVRESVGIRSREWKSRRQVLQRGLVRPLRTYRGNLLAHHLREKDKLKKLLESLDREPQKPGSSPESESSKIVPPVAN